MEPFGAGLILGVVLTNVVWAFLGLIKIAIKVKKSRAVLDDDFRRFMAERDAKEFQKMDQTKYG